MDQDAPRQAWASDLGACLGIGLLALVLRVAYVSQFVEHPLGRLAWVDEGAYWTRAQAIRAGHWLPDAPFYQDPLFPYALAGLSRVVGTDVARLRVGLACLGALTPVAVFWAARRGLGRTEGIVAGVIAAVYGPLVFTDGLIEKEGLGAFVAAMALGFAARAVSGGTAALAATGCALGVLTLLRANALILAPLGMAWAACLPTRPPDYRRTTRQRLLRALAFALGFGGALAPATVVNALVARPRELVLTTWQLGPNFYIGNGPEATGTYSAPDFVEANPAREADDFAREAQRLSARRLSPGQVSRFWLAQGLRSWREHPRRSVVLLLHKSGLLLHDFEIPDSQSLDFVRIVAAPALGMAFLSFGWLLPWCALGLARADRSPFWWFLVLTTATGLGSTALFFVVGRYRVPWAPGLCMLAATGLVDVARTVRNRQWRPLTRRLALLFLPACFLAWRPVSDPAPDRWGHGLINLALAEAVAGRLEPAIDALDEARALGRGPAERIDQLLTAGPLREAMGALVAARPDAERHPGGGPRADLRLARWMRQFPKGRAQSRRLLDRLLDANPASPDASRESGAWWLGVLDDASARPRAVEALTLAARRDGDAAVLLALIVNDGRVLPDSSSGRIRLARAIINARGREK